MIGEVEHLVNVLAVIANFQDFRLVARALALLANQFHIGEELHFDGHGAVALAASQRPPGMLNEKWPAAYPRFSLSGSEANSSRMASNALM